MAFNVGTISDLMELYAGQAGVNRDKIPRKLLRQVINFKLKEFASRSGILSSKNTIVSIADKLEYEMTPDVIHVTKVNFDGSIAHKIVWEDVDEIKNSIS